MKERLFDLAFCTLFLCSCGSGFNAGSKSGSKAGPDSVKTGFTIETNKQGFELSENGEPVFFYQREPKSRDGDYFFNNYLHPLYNLSGDTLTEEFPDDHYHHRGVFWAWHQLYMDEMNLGDQWMMEGIKQDVTSVETELDPSGAVIIIMATWISSALEKNASMENQASSKNNKSQNKGSFLEEQTTIIVHPGTENIRIIDFEIALTALRPGIRIGGSADQKGYGGFSVRLKMNENVYFTSERGVVSPQTLQLKAGPWMDISGPLGGNPETNGVTLLCRPETPNYPGTWILRQAKSMQNIVYPGQGTVPVQMEQPTVLKYRMIIHKGGSLNPNELK